MQVVELLLAAGADPSTTSRDGRTAADWARRRGMRDVAARLETATASSRKPISRDDPGTRTQVRNAVIPLRSSRHGRLDDARPRAASGSVCAIASDAQLVPADEIH